MSNGSYSTRFRPDRPTPPQHLTSNTPVLAQAGRFGQLSLGRLKKRWLSFWSQQHSSLHRNNLMEQCESLVISQQPAWLFART
ncbi:hypothetical protein [Synechococcus sp. Cu2B8-bc1011]|uniref:hypothetical protein n=1 Tax=Synechococcus sp. Cu2B8-bc1011 TaxID=3093725 RepID=UPI0039B0697B